MHIFSAKKENQQIKAVWLEVNECHFPTISESRIDWQRRAGMAKSNVQECCSGLILAVKCLSERCAPSHDSVKFKRIIGALGSHNSLHSRFNLPASNSYLWE